MSNAHTTAGLAAQPDPPTDRDSGRVPERIAPLLQIALILADYGRHLAATIEHRALWRGFATIAQFFGTATLAVIRPHIHRGIMRAMALERMLLERAGRGRDLMVPAPRVRRPSAASQPSEARSATSQPAEAAPAASQPTEAPSAASQLAEATSAPEARPAHARRIEEEPLTFDNMPSMADIEKEVRRRPPGRTVADICRDLGISPSLCLGPFWTMLFDAIHWYGGSVSSLIRDMREREKRLDRESWKHPKLGFPEATKEGIQGVLGFLIGEPPVDPVRPAADPSPAAADPFAGAADPSRAATDPLRPAAAPGTPVAATATGPP